MSATEEPSSGQPSSGQPSSGQPSSGQPISGQPGSGGRPPSMVRFLGGLLTVQAVALVVFLTWLAGSRLEVGTGSVVVLWTIATLLMVNGLTLLWYDGTQAIADSARDQAGEQP